MKKTLLIVALMAMSMNTFAQDEVAIFKADEAQEVLKAKGTEGTYTDEKKKTTEACWNMPAGTEVLKTKNVSMKVAYKEDMKTSSLSGETDKYKAINVGGVDYAMPTGLTGFNNPATVALTEAPKSGTVIQFDVKEDGYLYVFGKLSSNKPYFVWEGTAENEPSLVAYTLDMMPQKTLDRITFSLPADADGYYDATKDAAIYNDGTWYRWPEQIAQKWNGEGTWTKVGVNGIGVIKFPVYKEAGTYLVHAQGSKITFNGFLFSKDGKKEIKYLTEAPQDASGINDVVAAKAENAVLYNLAGQKVSKDYKGVVVANGKKFIQK